MLSQLSIRNVVLIERLELSFRPGLCVLTGETGAGKSILLDALGLALGGRADSALVRSVSGAPPEPASVAAAFDLPAGHAALALLDEHGLARPADGEPLVLRRTLAADGRSRAFVDDQPVAVQLLRALGETLVEVVGQFASRELADSASHRAALDAFAEAGADAEATAAAWAAWREAEAERAAAEAESEAVAREADDLRHAVAELDALAPQPGEADALAGLRTRLQHAERLGEAVAEAMAAVADGDGAEARLAVAHRTLTRRAGLADGGLDAALEALDRALAEIAEVRAVLDRAAAELGADPGRLEKAEERLFALRGLARKHNIQPDGLAALRETLAGRLAGLEDARASLPGLARKAAEAREGFLAAARALGAARRDAADRLDAAIARELAPLRLDGARFATVVEALDEAGWGPAGTDRVEFTASTNPDTPPGRLARIASGGELSRFMLALKVALAESQPVPTLVFDEVDSGIGGATSAAVGARLRRLGRAVQVLVVTHSPQVAALGDAHWRVVKRAARGRAGAATLTVVDSLDNADRREEIARMLAGARITEEARAAADSLLANASS